MKRFAVIGGGFWANYQLAAWGEVGGAECVAVCDIDREKAAALAARRKVDGIFTDPHQLLKAEQKSLDFVDVITPPNTHRAMVEMAAAHGVDVICQKPLAESLSDAEQMVRTCADAGVRLLVHENFRWQTPIRALAGAIGSGKIGDPFRARLHFCNSFPVFENQPLLARLDRFMLADVGVHILDVARFLFGEVESLYCIAQRVNPKITGEDVATIFLKMRSGMTVINEMSYASRTRDEAFPQTYACVEGSKGSAELVRDYWLHVTTKEGTESTQHSPPCFSWADPDYAVAHSSMVACHENLLRGLNGGEAETTGADNLETLRLVERSYDSAASNQVITL